jgi:hypothetical protein
MTREQIEAVLKASMAKLDKETGYVLPEGATLTLHAAHSGASVSFSKIESAKFEGELMFARNAKQVVAVSLADVFALAVEGTGGQPRRPAGFTAS